MYQQKLLFLLSLMSLASSLLATVTRQDIYPDNLTVEWKEKKVLPQKKKIVFQKGVIIYFDCTKIIADQLTLNLQERIGTAEGNIQLIDPCGILNADKIHFNWKTNCGEALNAKTKAAGIQIYVKSIKISRHKWVLDCANASFEPNDFLNLNSKKIIISKTRNGLISKPQIRLWDSCINLPDVPIDLIQDSSGIQLPKIIIRRDKSAGIEWEYPAILDEHFGMTLGIGAYSSRPLKRNFSLSWTAIPHSIQGGLGAPSDELDESFKESYWDNIEIKDLEQESRIISRKKAGISLSNKVNQSTRGRINDVHSITKNWEVAAELSDGINGSGYRFKGYVHSMRPNKDEPFQTRNILMATVNSGCTKIGNSLHIRSRLDTAFYSNDCSNYGWVRGQLGLVYVTSCGSQFSVAYTRGGTGGEVIFPFDIPHSLNFLAFRGDLKFGCTEFRIISRIDLDNSNSLDHQAGIIGSYGAFRPYIFWREKNNDIQLGFYMKIASVIDDILKR